MPHQGDWCRSANVLPISALGGFLVVHKLIGEQMSTNALRCKHGANYLFCTFGCTEGVEIVGSGSRLGEYGFHGGETKQDVLNDICDLLALPRHKVSRGSSIPSIVMRAAAREAGAAYHSMPQACEAVVVAAGMSWSPDFDSRSTQSGGGSTVTLEGMQALRKALGRIV